MHSIEVEGKTVKEAVKIALEKLNLPRNKVTIKILHEGKKGLFGMEGSEPTRVRVTTKE